MTLSVIVPIYNEDETCIEILKRVSAVDVDKEIIVVDDGSANDISPAIHAAAIPNLRLIAHERNQGKGAAIRTGLAEATGDIVIIQDADTEYSPEDYPWLLAEFKQKRVKAVYGVRNLSGRSTLMKFGNHFVTWATNLLYGSTLQDMETCYKMVDRRLFQSLELVSNGFEIEAEISAKLLRLKIPIAQVPIQYTARTIGKKLTPMDGIPTLFMLFKTLLWQPSEKAKLALSKEQ
jgi:glycosyltransferase involved in cell wall biosynthesis